MFLHLKPGQYQRLAAFVDSFIESAALLDSPEHLIRYLTQVAREAASLAVRAINRVLDHVGERVADLRLKEAAMEPDMVRLALHRLQVFDRSLFES